MTSRRLTRRTLPVAIGELCSRDPDLAAIVDRYGPPPLWARRPGFATLVLTILEQQVSLASAKAVFVRLGEAVGPLTPKNVAARKDEELRGAGLTRQKAGYVLELARRAVDGRLNLPRVSRAGDEEARSMLVEMKGIGSWTANCYLLFALGRPDVWPPGDLALNKSMRDVKRLDAIPDDDTAGRIAEAWRPWRSVGARLLWHSYLSRANESKGA